MHSSSCCMVRCSLFLLQGCTTDLCSTYCSAGPTCPVPGTDSAFALAEIQRVWRAPMQLADISPSGSPAFPSVHNHSMVPVVNADIKQPQLTPEGHCSIPVAVRCSPAELCTVVPAAQLPSISPVLLKLTYSSPSGSRVASYADTRFDDIRLESAYLCPLAHSSHKRKQQGWWARCTLNNPNHLLVFHVLANSFQEELHT